MKKVSVSLIGMFLCFAFLFAGSVRQFTVTSKAVSGKAETGFDSKLKSDGRIDSAYTAKDNGPGNHVSFPFEWKGLPAGTKALALVYDDPDAKPVLAIYGKKDDSFLHWIAADIDPKLNGLKANASADNPRFVQGVNGAGSTNYTGPQPPSDLPKGLKKPLIHIYRLTVFALSAPTGLTNGFSLADLKAAIKGKTLAEGHLNMSYNN